MPAKTRRQQGHAAAAILHNAIFAVRELAGRISHQHKHSAHARAWLTTVYTGAFVAGLSLFAASLVSPFEASALANAKAFDTDAREEQSVVIFNEAPLSGTRFGDLALKSNADGALRLSHMSGEDTLFQSGKRYVTRDGKMKLVADLNVGPRWINLTVEPGDTFMDLITKTGADERDAHAAIEALKEQFNPRDLKVGQEVKIAVEPTYEIGNADSKKLLEIALAADAERTVRVLRGEDDSFITKEILSPLSERVVRVQGTIDSSLFMAAQKAAIPPSVIVALIRMFSYDVDFQRDTRTGDSFEIFYSRYYNDANAPVRDGVIRYAAITLGGKEKAYYRFTPGDDGEADYFDANGQSAKKFLMRTPIDGARLSSGYGSRLHPILGYTKMHTGTDFAAPSGTPIYAAGTGTVEKAGPNGSYGNYVKIRHANGYQTAYAHMSRFASGIRSGAHVAQGQTIGYVGTTGRSTGPHLHYEIFVKNSRVNPMSIKAATGRKLEGRELATFERARDDVERVMAQIPLKTDVASAAIDISDLRGGKL